MTDHVDAEPTLSPKVLTEDTEILTRAVEKWLKFQTSMWEHVNLKLETSVSRNTRWSIAFRVAIIVLSATVTTVSDINDVPRTVVTILAGTFTALTGLEAFLKFADRQSEERRQQREIEALRDKLRYDWFVHVEIEPEMKTRLDAAKRLLKDGPEQYNEVLNKYALKAEGGPKPEVNH